VAEAFGYVDRHSRVHCRERNAVEDEGLKSTAEGCVVGDFHQTEQGARQTACATRRIADSGRAHNVILGTRSSSRIDAFRAYPLLRILVL
jgi:hypothetical protein